MTFAADATAPLEEIIVTAGGSQVTLPEDYAGGQIARGGRVGMFGNLDIMDTPFTGTAYTAALIQDQQARSVADVLQNDPTVRISRGFGNFQELYVMRGFPIYSDDITYNGIYGILPRQYVAAELLERVEVFRGANTFLNGAAPGGTGLGGALNMVPKRAGLEPLTRFTLGYENASAIHGALDVGRRFANDSTGVRINLARRDGETSVSDQERELSVAAIGMDFQGEQFRLSADMGYQDHRIDAPRPNVTPLSSIPAAPEASTNFAQPWTYTREKQVFAVARGEYDITSRISLWAAAGMRRGEESNVLANPDAQSDGSLSSIRFDNEREEDVFSADVGLRAEFRTGSVGHRLVVSASTLSTDNRNAYAMSDFNTPFISDLHRPVARPAPVPDAFVGGDLSDPRTTSKTRTASLAIADMISLANDHLLVTLGARHQSIDTRSHAYGTAAFLSGYDESRITPALAAVLRVSDQWSWYANYVEGLMPGEVAPATTNDRPLSNAGEIFKPYRAKQYETGVKYDRGDLGATLSAFQTTQPRSRIVGDVFAISGEQRNRGLELSAYGQPIPELKILGGVTLLEAQQHRTQDGLLDGNRALGVPDLQATVNIEWSLTETFSLEGRVVHTSSQYANEANTIRVDAWTRADAGVRYQMPMGERSVALRARVENLTDRRYWASVGGTPGANYLILGAPRTFLMSASLDF